MTNLQEFYNWEHYRPILAKKWPLSELTNGHFWPLVTSNEVENSVYVFIMSNYLDLIPHMTNLQQFYNWDHYRPILAKKWPLRSLQMAIFGL